MASHNWVYQNLGNIGTNHANIGAYLEILEQPAPFARFRYESELRPDQSKPGRSVSGIEGIHSTRTNKTFVKFRLRGYSNREEVYVKITCVEKDEPLRRHPNKLMVNNNDNNYCCNGQYMIRLLDPNKAEDLSRVGIVTTKRNDMQRSNVHDRPIDYHALCLCFQAFTPDSCTGILQPLTAPVVSNVIHNASKKNTSTDCAPKIMKMSHYEASASCPQPVIMLTTHVPNDTEIIFREFNKDNKTVWEGKGEFKSSDIHKRWAITFIPPKYTGISPLIYPKKVWVYLKCHSGNTDTNTFIWSQPQPFTYLPDESGSGRNCENCTRTPAMIEFLQKQVQLLEQQVKEQEQLLQQQRQQLLQQQPQQQQQQGQHSQVSASLYNTNSYESQPSTFPSYLNMFEPQPSNNGIWNFKIPQPIPPLVMPNMPYGSESQPPSTSSFDCSQDTMDSLLSNHDLDFETYIDENETSENMSYEEPSRELCTEYQYPCTCNYKTG